MKKIMSVLIIFIFLICCFSSVYAADENVSVTLSKSKLKEGDTFVMTVSAKNNAGLNGINATVEYDKNVIQLVESKLVDTANWSEYDSFPKLTAMWKTSNSSTKSAKIYTIKFKVKKVEKNKTSNIKLKGITLSLNSANDVKLGDITKKVSLQTSSSKKTNTSKKTSSALSNSSSSSGSTSSSKNNNSSEIKKITTNRSSSSDDSKVIEISTNSKEDLPKTGKNIVLKILIPVMIVVTIVFYKKYKEYIDV